MEPETFDLIVIGSGPAGESGAETAAIFGKRVALVEKNPLLGGASTNTGTLPSKTLRETALAISGLRSRDLYGVDLSLRREASITDFMYHERRVTANERQRVSRNIARRGITLYRGTAEFVDPHTIRITPTDPTGDAAEVVVRGERFLIATGSSPVQPPGFAFSHPRVHDSDEILELDHLPRSLAVIGAGVIGSEYACTFAALGTKVYVVDGRDELLPFLDHDLSAALESAMRENLGIEFLWKERATSCEAPEVGDVTLTLTSGRRLTVDAVLIAAGRKSNTERLNLPAAGITPKDRGLIAVDEHYRTSAPHIYAAGDVIGYPALASTSMEQARVAMCHAFDIEGYQDFMPLLPSGIYTIPEVSTVGRNEEELVKAGVDYVVGKAPYALNARGSIIGDKVGFLKLLFDRAEMKLIGVHVIGEHASEVVHIGLIAMLAGQGAQLFMEACFNYPTLGDLYKHATFDAMLNRSGLGQAESICP